MIPEITNYIKNHKGKLYASIPYKGFKGMSLINNDRSEEILQELKKHKNLKTVVDIGSHWGSICYILADAGYDVTATENTHANFKALEWLKNETGANFKTEKIDVLSDGYKCEYDVIVALNIFHHFLKTEDKYRRLNRFLNNAKFKIMFFQSHSIGEKQMDDAYCDYDPETFAQFVTEITGKKRLMLIRDGRRPVYKIW